MRIALLSALEPLSGGVLSPRGFARIGGRTLLQNQVDFALASGCDRIACLSNDLPSELIALQHSAEKAGAQFQSMRDIRSLSGLVAASDELLVVADGVMLDSNAASDLMDAGRMIASFPVDEGLAAGFERIDRERSWAGVMLVGGGLVEKLAELPSDIDAQSSLLRLALQSGVPCKPLAPSLIADNRWAMIDTAEMAQEFSNQWLGNNAPRGALASPTRGLADLAAIAVLKRHTDPARAAKVVRGLSAALLFVAAVAGYFMQPIAGLVAVIASVFSYRFSETTFSVVDSSGQDGKFVRVWRVMQSLAIDALLVALMLVSVAGLNQSSALFAIIMLIGTVRLIEVPQPQKAWAWLHDLMTDRGLIAAICMIGLGLGGIIPVIQLVAAFFLALQLLRTYRSKLT